MAADHLEFTFRRVYSRTQIALAALCHALTVLLLLTWALGALRLPVVLLAVYVGLNDYVDTRRTERFARFFAGFFAKPEADAGRRFASSMRSMGHG